MVNTVQSILLNYQSNYNSNRNYQSNRVSNKLMFAQHGKTGYNEGDGKEKDKIPRRNLDQIICNDCGDKVHYAGNIDWPTQTKLKEYEDAFRNTKQEKYSNKPPGGGYQKPLVNVKYAFCSIMMGDPTEEWGEPPSPGLMFCQTLTQEAP